MSSVDATIVAAVIALVLSAEIACHDRLEGMAVNGVKAIRWFAVRFRHWRDIEQIRARSGHSTVEIRATIESMMKSGESAGYAVDLLLAESRSLYQRKKAGLRWKQAELK